MYVFKTRTVTLEVSFMIGNHYKLKCRNILVYKHVFDFVHNYVWIFSTFWDSNFIGNKFGKKVCYLVKTLIKTKGKCHARLFWSKIFLFIFT